MVSMNMIFKWILLLALLFSSCSEDKILPIDSPSDVSDSNGSITEAVSYTHLRAHET